MQTHSLGFLCTWLDSIYSDIGSYSFQMNYICAIDKSTSCGRIDRIKHGVAFNEKVKHKDIMGKVWSPLSPTQLWVK